MNRADALLTAIDGKDITIEGDVHDATTQQNASLMLLSTPVAATTALGSQNTRVRMRLNVFEAEESDWDDDYTAGDKSNNTGAGGDKGGAGSNPNSSANTNAGEKTGGGGGGGEKSGAGDKSGSSGADGGGGEDINVVVPDRESIKKATLTLLNARSNKMARSGRGSSGDHVGDRGEKGGDKGGDRADRGAGRTRRPPNGAAKSRTRGRSAGRGDGDRSE